MRVVSVHLPLNHSGPILLEALLVCPLMLGLYWVFREPLFESC